MEKKSAIQLNRRDFIRQAACAAVGTAAMTSAIRDLRFMNAAVAQTGINDYKALICIFQGGGNDSNNLIIPTITAEYNNYAAIRAPVSMSVTLAGANTFEVGKQVCEYADSTGGAISLSGVSGTRLQALTNILGLASSNLQAKAYAGIANHSINSGTLLNTAIGATSDPSGTQQFWTVPFPGSGTFQVTTPPSR